MLTSNSKMTPSVFSEQCATELHVLDEFNQWLCLLSAFFSLLGKNLGVRFITNPPLGQFNTVNLVTQSIEHAIGSKRPQNRYVVGLDAYLIYRPLSLLPDEIVDALYYLSLRNVIKGIERRNERVMSPSSPP